MEKCLGKTLYKCKVSIPFPNYYHVLDSPNVEFFTTIGQKQPAVKANSNLGKSDTVLENISPKHLMGRAAPLRLKNKNSSVFQPPNGSYQVYVSGNLCPVLVSSCLS